MTEKIYLLRRNFRFDELAKREHGVFSQAIVVAKTTNDARHIHANGEYTWDKKKQRWVDYEGKSTDDWWVNPNLVEAICISDDFKNEHAVFSSSGHLGYHPVIIARWLEADKN